MLQEDPSQPALSEAPFVANWWRPLALCLLGGALLLVLLSAVPAQEAAPDGGIRVVSLNIASKRDVRALATELRRRNLHQADIYLLQEVIGESQDRSQAALDILPGRHLHVLYRSAFQRSPGQHYGLAVLSRYPLEHAMVLPLQRHNLNLRSRVRIALTASVLTPSGPLTVVNTHLDTRINWPQRLQQLEPILAHANKASGPVILGGDFNTHPHRWILHLVPIPFVQPQPVRLRQHMASLGYASALYSPTATHDVLGMQLDWIFARGLLPRDSRVQPLRHSDHHAIAATLHRSAPSPAKSQTTQ